MRCFLPPGTTVDIILRNGQIKEGDLVVLSGIEGAFATTVRAVLTPHPMKEMRVKNNYIQHKVVRAAQVLAGVLVICPVISCRG